MPPIPRPVLALALADLGLVALYVGTRLAYRAMGIEPAEHSLHEMIKSLADIEAEASLASWYSTLQLALVAGMLGVHAQRCRRVGASRLMWLPVVVVLMFSIDEIVMVHEWMGFQLDALMPSGSRKDTVLHYTGLWGFAIGVPVLGIVGTMLFSLRSYYRQGRAFALLLSGASLLIVGAAGMDLVANFTIGDSWLHGLQVVLEEGAEMFAVTLMFWGAWQLLYEPDSTDQANPPPPSRGAHKLA